MLKLCSYVFRRTLVFACVFCLSLSSEGVNAQTFHITDPIDLGSNLDQIGDLSWNYILGTDWDRDFNIGGIIGKQNAVVIPEVREPVFNNVIIPEVTADTRTGLRMTGNIEGSTGLEFYADFNAGGLETGTSFEFEPQIVDLPSQVSTGEFFKLQTTPGVVNNAAFTEQLIELPSFEAGMDFFFNLDVDSRIDYGLFPFVPYDSIQFNPSPLNVDQSLVKFGFDLDPDGNGGVGAPPEFVIFEDTPFEERLGLLDNNESIYEKQISVDMSVEGSPITQRLDIGSVQLVNPFGTGDSILGPNERNLTVNTGMDDETISYSYETALLRMGLDLDGIAAYLGTSALTGVGDSFTRIEEKFLDDKISLAIDLLDIKYGPEIGFRESVNINPDFEVTLSFDQNVALDVDGVISITNTYSGKWSDLPGIALLGDQNVEVSVDFNYLTGEQTKRSVFYLTDYLELTLFELESLGIEGGPEFSLPPLYQGRTSLLGSLLGEVELELTEQTQTIAPFAFNSGLAGSNSFTLTPIPTTIVYLATNDTLFSSNVSAWKTLSDHMTPASLMDATLVLATGDSSDQLITDLDPLVTSSPNSNVLGDFSGGATTVRGLVIPEGTGIVQHQSNPGRTWNISSIINDGDYVTRAPSPVAINGVGLTISGQGVMHLQGPLDLDAVLFKHGEGHLILMRNTAVATQNTLDTQQFDNAGDVQVSQMAQVNLVATQRFDNSGSFYVSNGAQGTITTPLIANEGVIGSWNDSSLLEISSPDTFGQINLQSTNGSGLFQANFDGTLRFTHTVLLATPGGTPQPLRFEATNGSAMEFDGPIRAFEAGVAELYVDETSSMVLNGVEVKREDGNVTLVNKGVVDVMSGGNLFYYNPSIPWGPGEEPLIIGINVENDGTIRIHPNAKFGFKAEIANYTPGGATLGPGTWEILGAVPANPFPNDGQAFAPGRAELEISIARITNEDAYLGRIDFGDTNGDGIHDGYSAEDYDTELSVSEANVLLSGAARFNYFNTIRENRGTFTLRNKNHFTTAGDLHNSGTINIELDARLNVSGNLVVDEGTVFVDGSSILDVGTNSVEVLGGNITVDRGAVPLFVNTPWIIREKWLGEGEMGSDIIQEARVSYGDAWFPTLGPNADVLLDGEQAVFEPLAGLNLVQGKLSLVGGNELHLAQSLTNNGTIELESAGKLIVDGDVLTTGMLAIGSNSYLEVSGAFTTSGGSIDLDGVVQAASLTIDTGTVLTGSGQFAGILQNNAMVSPGNSPGVLEVLGDYSQSTTAMLGIEVAGTLTGVDFDQLLVSETATLEGILDVSLLGGYALEAGQEFTVLSAGELVDNGLALSGSSASFFDLIITPGTDGSVVLKFLGGSFPYPADFNNDGFVNGGDLSTWNDSYGQNNGADADGDGDSDGYDFLVWQRQFGSVGVPAATGTAVPEPESVMLLLISMLALCVGQRHRFEL
ncbi:hypothetical protein [Bythopirellula goksoeyrii]|uniref:Autotransporter-associated beta strand repeat protein n=1 Tax=Bythopirellula goksoeyrii TaxID=1400387 RepID=A0A5B9QG88_9BACT|nr:hypothetical protein [Bythopirellula goksoeyrii]QEG33361.1 hypothetical protein Pr1d_06220 [Bythopirellula goksoeyrii]